MTPYSDDLMNIGLLCLLLGAFPATLYAFTKYNRPSIAYKQNSNSNHKQESQLLLSSVVLDQRNQKDDKINGSQEQVTEYLERSVKLGLERMVDYEIESQHQSRHHHCQDLEERSQPEYNHNED